MLYFLDYLYMYFDVCEGGIRDWNGVVYEDDVFIGYI